MPQFVIPHRSGVHRLACLSLYHALLTQCRRMPIPEPKQHALQNFIKLHYRHSCHEQSPSKILSALDGGYEALDLLYKSSRGDGQSFLKLQGLIQQAQKLKNELREQHAYVQSLRPPKLPTEEQKTKQRNKTINRGRPTHPNTESIFSRPRLVVSGRRRVPILAFWRNIPFLRIKKPQPPSLGVHLRTRRDKHARWVDQYQRFTNDVVYARMEDEWDRMIGLDDSLDEEPTWASAIDRARREASTNLALWEKENIERTTRLLEVVKKEKELAAKEKAERAALKQRLRRRRLSESKDMAEITVAGSAEEIKLTTGGDTLDTSGAEQDDTQPAAEKY